MALSDLQKTAQLFQCQQEFEGALANYASSARALKETQERLMACQGFEEMASQEDKDFILSVTEKVESGKTDIDAVLLLKPLSAEAKAASKEETKEKIG